MARFLCGALSATSGAAVVARWRGGAAFVALPREMPPARPFERQPAGRTEARVRLWRPQDGSLRMCYWGNEAGGQAAVVTRQVTGGAGFIKTAEGGVSPQN